MKFYKTWKTILPYVKENFSTRSGVFIKTGPSSRAFSRLSFSRKCCFELKRTTCCLPDAFLKDGSLTRTKVVDLGRLSSSSSFESYQPKKIGAKKRNPFLRVFKAVLLVTGACVWVVLIFFWLLFDEVKFEKSEQANISSEPWGMDRNLRFLGITDNENHSSDMEALMISENDQLKLEIGSKMAAFSEVWQKLSKEEGVQESLGSSVEICGYKCYGWTKEIENPWNIDGDETNKWKASCYVEGQKGAAILSILFERHHTESEWIATKVHLEKVKESGEVICDVSSQLPNGLRNFIRLSDA